MKYWLSILEILITMNENTTWCIWWFYNANIAQFVLVKDSSFPSFEHPFVDDVAVCNIPCMQQNGAKMIAVKIAAIC